MLGFGKKKQVKTPPAHPDQKVLSKNLNEGLSKTRKTFKDNVADALLGKRIVSKTLLEDLETHLLTADMGIEATQYFIKELSKQISRKNVKSSDMLLVALKEIMTESLTQAQIPLTIDENKKPFVIMMVGVNGAGKTTTIGKLTKRLQNDGKNIMLSAGDTFRAAAVEQLQTWGERNNVPVVAQQSGADSAAVSFDAIQSAQSKGMDVLIADTAGRLHTQTHLMEELKKIKRVMMKVDEHAPHEVLLVLDASIGQNALQQAKLFHEAIGVTGLCITKLDGTAKGGMVFAIVKELGLPIRFIGVGEQVDDLQAFNAKAFVDALFG